MCVGAAGWSVGCVIAISFIKFLALARTANHSIILIGTMNKYIKHYK